MRRKLATCALVLVAGVLTACEKVSVTTVAVSSVEVSPAEVSLVEGGSVQLSATLRDEDGHVLSGRDITWTTGDGGIATVDGQGTVTGLSNGVASIRASTEGSVGQTSVTVFQGPTVGLSRSTVDFLGSSNGPEPDPVVVAIFNDGAGSLEGLRATVDYGESTGGWLLASLGALAAPTTLTVAADADDLPPGDYVAAVEIAASDAELTRLTVTFSVDESAAVIGLSTQSMSFAHVSRSPTPAPRVVTISNLGGQELSGLGAGITYHGGGSGWLTASLSPTTAPAALTLGVAPESLPSGTYDATVHITAPTALNSPVSVSVTLDVENPPPEIQLGTPTLTFSVPQGGPITPPQLVTVTNGGGGELTDLEVATSYVGSTTGWLNASLVAGEAPTTVSITANPNGVPPGTQLANVVVSSPVAPNSPQVIAVTLIVAANPPLIVLSSSSVDLNAKAGSATADEVAINVTNGGGGTLGGLAASVVYESGQPSGWLTAGFAGSAAPTTLDLSASALSLTNGSYNATVSLTSTNASNNPLTVDVNFIVGSPPTAPSGLSATVVSSSLITLAWNDNSDDEQRFEVERKAGAGAWAPFAVIAPNTEDASDATVLPGTTYTYRVRACGPDVCSAASNLAVATTPAAAAAPLAPTGATAVAASGSEVSVAWVDNSDNETRFEVQRSTDGGGSWSLVGQAAPDEVVYTDNTAQPGTAYWYRIRGCNGIGCSDFSNTATATTPPPTPPAAPSGPAASATSFDQVDISWTDNSPDEDSFEVERSVDGGATWSPLAALGANQTSHVDGAVEPETSYWYRVRACNADGCSNYTSSASVTTPAAPTPPAAPSGPAAVATAHDRVDVSWSDNSDDEDSFEVERSLNGGGTWTTIATTGPNQQSYIDGDVSANNQFWYRIRACNSAGCSSFSGVVSATTPDAPQPPDAVSNLTATAVSTSRIDLSWTDNSDDETRFELQWRRGTNGSWRWSASVGPNVTSFSATGLREDRTHQFRVRACNDQGCSSWTTAQARTHDD